MPGRENCPAETTKRGWADLDRMEVRHAVTVVAVGLAMLLVALLLGACGPSKRPSRSGSATRTEIVYSCADAECIVGTDGLNPVVLPFPARTSTRSGSATTLSTGVCSVSPGGAVAACPQATDHLVGDGGNYSDLRLVVVHTDGTHRHTIWSLRLAPTIRRTASIFLPGRRRGALLARAWRSSYRRRRPRP